MATISVDLVARVKAAKARRRAASIQYQENSRIAFVVHCFNRISNVNRLMAGLRRAGPAEIIVCDDGSLDGSREKWTSHLNRPNDFLVMSNDLHEIRILDRAIRFARAEVVCLVQDDDSIPGDSRWLDATLQRFDRHPKLAILGGFMGFGSFDPDPVKAKPIWGAAPFQFVQHVNIGPYFIRKEHYLELGGWDFSFSGVGEPGICFDNELCLRAWTKGFQVGYSFVPFKGPAGHYSLDGGTVLFSHDVRRRNQLRNQDRIFEMYSPHRRRIEQRVAQANRALGNGSGRGVAPIASGRRVPAARTKAR